MSLCRATVAPLPENALRVIPSRTGSHGMFSQSIWCRSMNSSVTRFRRERSAPIARRRVAPYLLRLDTSFLDQGRPVGQLGPDICFKLRPPAPETLDARCFEAVLDLNIRKSFLHRGLQRDNDIVGQVCRPGQSSPGQNLET